FSVDKVPAEVIKVIDLKCPDSGEAAANDWGNCALVKPHDQFKFVVASKADFDWAQKACAEHGLYGKCPVLYSPVAGKVRPIELAEWILEAGAPVTMQLQMHKEIWGPDQRGV
ncbi:7-carboxy-7-deazaguanine synthase QueE, partial [bacterium]|nr:7-carboxy-7-deazaguanine synthase QueE [bacterium]